MTLFLIILLIFLLIMLNAFFAGSETGVYRLSRVRLRIGHEKGKRKYKILFSLLKDGQGLILSLLLGTNLANYVLTSVVTMTILARINDQHLAEVYTTVILTPVLFVFAELIPKNIMYFQADSLLPHFSWAIWGFDKIFTFSGAKIILKKIANLISSCLHLEVDTTKAIDTTHRHQVYQIIHETQEEGLLSQTQREMMTRLIDFPSVSLASVMIPLQKVDTISVETSRDDLIKHLRNSRFTRQLVYQSNPVNIVGYISIYDVLSSGRNFRDIRDFIIPLMKLDKKSSVIDAINQMRNRRERIAIVVESTRKEIHPVGMITISDLVEEITGELNL